MSADVLRRAANQLREWWPDCDCHKAERAIADWLDEQAVAYHYNERAWTAGAADHANRWAERGLTVRGNLEHHHRHALTVARAYLGESA